MILSQLKDISVVFAFALARLAADGLLFRTLFGFKCLPVATLRFFIPLALIFALSPPFRLEFSGGCPLLFLGTLSICVLLFEIGDIAGVESRHDATVIGRVATHSVVFDRTRVPS
mmetsp:Transcript_19016/g.59006  ORF Transcript_19016/g.59006 Transcript_19016/m.59006 type:complete len:115 (+) Transcript_19016:23-367(+)